MTRFIIEVDESDAPAMRAFMNIPPYDAGCIIVDDGKSGSWPENWHTIYPKSVTEIADDECHGGCR